MGCRVNQTVAAMRAALRVRLNSARIFCFSRAPPLLMAAQAGELTERMSACDGLQDRFVTGFW